ncbi:MAG: endonuclease/exonuclease/phosphatase family protein [bacterium]|nr:endonuclease/exonuclease/phosphatase family protein [bacterium]
MSPRASRPTLRGVLDVVAAVLALVTATAFVPASPWPLELTTHFRVQYATGFALLALIAAAMRRWKPVVLLVAGALVNAVVAASPASPGGVADAAAPRLRVLFANVLRVNPAHVAGLEVIRAAAADVVVAAEVDAGWWEALRTGLPDHRHTLAEPREDDFGIALLSRVALVRGEVVGLDDLDMPTVIAELPLGGGALTLVATHTIPPVGLAAFAERNAHLAALARVARMASGPALVLGDLNVTPWSPWFGRLLRDGGLRDSRVGFGLQASWPAGAWPLLRIPIDHALASPSLRVLDRRVGAAYGSDHLPIVVDVALAG